MPVLSIPAGTADLTPEWLTAALSDFSDGAVVRSVVANRMGGGAGTESFRLIPDWDRPTCAPASVVVRVSGPHGWMAHDAEVSFYNELARTVRVHTPLCFQAKVDPIAGGGVVLLEDLAPGEAGDQGAGCRASDAVSAISELVALHTAWWGDRTLLELAWLERPRPGDARQLAAFLTSRLGSWFAKYRNRLGPGVEEVIRSLAGRLGRYLAHRPGPWTLVHGDFRAGNLLFGGARVAVVGWGAVKVGPPVADLSYLLGSSLLPDVRAAEERDLVRYYVEGLGREGVSLDPDLAWEGYRRYAFDGLVAGLRGSMLADPDDDGALDVHMTMVNRHGRQAIDLDSLRLIP